MVDWIWANNVDVSIKDAPNTSANEMVARLFIDLTSDPMGTAEVSMGLLLHRNKSHVSGRLRAIQRVKEAEPDWSLQSITKSP
jgi:hypothetical protein